ncbi:MAG: hypothetical protein M1837_004019 [Sclerophora amabilis]|nr:MAG: hypothetical protein M1837_004019 [Sclerophora amabilis]
MATSERADSKTMDELASNLSSLGVSNISSYPNCYPERNSVDIFRSHLADVLAPVTGVESAKIYPVLQRTQTLDKGDLVLPVPALRIKGKKPNELAAEWLEKFPDSPLVERPSLEGTFMQFFFKPSALSKLLIPCILQDQSNYGFNQRLGLKDPNDAAKGRKRIIVEFSSPNIAKPFHAGHLRSTIIGGFLANIYEGAGWEVTRMNYLGDWGTQFGLLAMGWEMFGDETKLQENPIAHLYDIYVEVNKLHVPEHEAIKEKKAKGEDVTDLEKKSWGRKAQGYFKKMEDGDEEMLAIWRRFRDLSIDRYKQTYARLNIKYDIYSGESQIKSESMEAAMKTLWEKGLNEESKGAVIVDLEKYNKKLGKCRVKKEDGTTLYLTRDIGAALERYEKFQFDKMIYVVAMQQDLHLAQLFKILNLMGREDVAEKCQHINFGMVQGMSTRKGTVKFLDDILRDVGDKMHEVMRANEDKYSQVTDPEKVADTLGITSVMVQDMSGKRINNYEFNIDRMTSFEGDTGPYLQYAHARLCSITRRAAIPRSALLTANLSLLTEPHAISLIRSLAQWPDVFANTLKTSEPTTVLTYLFKMTHLLSSSYDHLRIVGSEEELATARMTLYECARQILGNGMRLLGLSPVERYVFPPLYPRPLSASPAAV